MTSHHKPKAMGFLGVLQELHRGSQRNRLGTEAASIAFYFFLSFFPLILTIFALTGLLGRESAFDWIMNELLVALPEEASAYIGEFVGQVTSSRSASALSIGLLLSVWTASNVFTVLADGLNKAYLAKRRHHWWKRRAMALALLMILSVAMIALAVIVLAGPAMARLLQLEPMGGALAWPLTSVLSVSMMWLIFYWLPNHDQSRSKRWILAGAMAGTVMWAAVTLLFRLFLASTGRFAAVYGIVGGIAAFLIWLYLTAMSVLVGGELAAALERRAAIRRRLQATPSARPPQQQARLQGG